MRLTLPLLLATAALSGPLNARSYDCVFSVECLGRAACQTDLQVGATLAETQGAWSLRLGEETLPVVALPAGGDRVFSGYIHPFDAGADAIALISLFADGTAFLSTHGAFLTPGIITNHGTCQGKEL